MGRAQGTEAGGDLDLKDPGWPGWRVNGGSESGTKSSHEQRFGASVSDLDLDFELRASGLETRDASIRFATLRVNLYEIRSLQHTFKTVSYQKYAAKSKKCVFLESTRKKRHS